MATCRRSTTYDPPRSATSAWPRGVQCTVASSNSLAARRKWRPSRRPRRRAQQLPRAHTATLTLGAAANGIMTPRGSRQVAALIMSVMFSPLSRIRPARAPQARVMSRGSSVGVAALRERTERLSRLLFHRELLCIVEHQIHVLVKPLRAEAAAARAARVRCAIAAGRVCSAPLSSPRCACPRSRTARSVCAFSARARRANQGQHR